MEHENKHATEKAFSDTDFRIKYRNAGENGRLVQQLWYYAMSLILNLVMIYSWYKLENSYGYFQCTGNRMVFVALVVAGAPLSSFLSIMLFFLRDFSLFSGLSLTAIQATHTKMKALIEKRPCNDFLILMSIFS